MENVPKDSIGSSIRKIIHIDMDAFYTSVEQRDNPDYRGKPIAVGGSSKRGVVAAASYEARKYGVRSAMPSALAMKKCPHLIFVASRFDVYRDVSRQIMKIFRDYTDLVEPLSLDEAYLDVTRNKLRITFATIIANEIRARIKAETGLTASAGISYNKFLAKVASDLNKPNGYAVITPEDAPDFITRLPVSKFHGIGKVTAEKMKKMGIHTGADLKNYSQDDLIRWFGKSGSFYYQIVRGIDQRRVSPVRVRKSVGAERTFEEDITDREAMILQIGTLARMVSERLGKKNFRGKTVTLKFKYLDFEQHTRSRSLSDYISDSDSIFKICLELLDHPHPLVKPVRLLGITLSNLNNQPKREENTQLTLEF